jgi:hypothetical protein
MTRRKAHKNWVCLSTPINLPFLVFFPNSVCVCVCVRIPTCLNHGLKTPEKHNSLLCLGLVQRHSQFSALHKDLNTEVVHYGCRFSTGPQPSGGHICLANNNKMKNTDRSSECCWHCATNNKTQQQTTMRCSWGVPLQLS